jgi:hypothetical protein
MYRSVLAVSLILLMAAAPVPQVPAPNAASSTLSCVSKTGNARIATNVTGTPKSIRVYFKGEGGKSCGEYFVDMKPGGSPYAYSALLPTPDAATTAISYQVRIDYGDGKIVTQNAATVPVSSACAAPSLTASELRTAKNIVLGLTSAGQPESPCAFRCNGITAVLMPNNTLKPNEACRQSAVRRLLATASGKGGAGSAGITTVGAVAATAVVIAGGFAFAANRNSSRDRQVSPSRP